MHDYGGMDHGWMMVVGGFVWLLIIIALLLSIAALLKYLRSGPK